MMNSEERQRAEELRDVIQAALDGKIIEVRYIGPNKNITKFWYSPYIDSEHNSNIIKILNRFSPELYKYRVAPDPQFGPYKSSDDVYRYLHEHKEVELKEKKTGETRYIIISPKHKDVICVCEKFRDGAYRCCPLENLFNNYIWSDGHPCGIRIK